MFIKGENIYAVAGNPNKLMQDSKVNGGVNAKKTVRIKDGRAWELAKACAASQSRDNASPGATTTTSASAEQTTTVETEDQEQLDHISESTQPPEQAPHRLQCLASVVRKLVRPRRPLSIALDLESVDLKSIAPGFEISLARSRDSEEIAVKQVNIGNSAIRPEIVASCPKVIPFLFMPLHRCT